LEASEIPYQETNKFSKLVIDYVNENPNIKPFIDRFPALDNFEKQIIEKKNHPVNRDVLVEVLDVPYVVTSLDVVNNNNLIFISFVTNVDTEFIIGKDNPLWMEGKEDSNELIPYSLVNNGLIAKVSRSVNYELAG
jgi:hypothetical protein